MPEIFNSRIFKVLDCFYDVVIFCPLLFHRNNLGYCNKICYLFGAGVEDGLKVIPRIPPMSAKRNPIKNPPKVVIQLKSESRSTIIPHVFAEVGLEYIIIPPMIVTIPITTPI